MINFSIIIPHRNIPVLLQRCLDSIPVRDDLEVIVVDDNSDEGIVCFEQFPHWRGDHYSLLLTKEGKGAGYARNVGLSHAKGKWILFVDADDFYSEDFPAFLDKLVDAEEDLIIFDHRSVLSSDVSVSVDRSVYLSNLIKDYLAGRIDERMIRCKFVVVTCKMIRKELLDRYHIRFSDAKWSNDIYFSAQVSCYADKLRVCPDIISVYTVRDGSLTSDYCGTRKEAIVRLQEALKCDRLYYKHGLNSRRNFLSSSLMNTIYQKYGFRWCLKSCVAAFFNQPVFSAMFVFLIKKKYLRFFHR